MSFRAHTCSLFLVTICFLPAVVLLSYAHSHTRTDATQPEQAAGVYQELAQRDVANGALVEALSKQSDVGDISKKLQLKEALASTLSASDLETLKQSLLKTMKYMLVDLAPPGFLEARVAEYYGSLFNTSEAQWILDSYDANRERLEGSLLNTARLAFWAELFQDLATEAKSWSRSFKIPNGGMLPTFVPGDHIVVNKRAYGTAAPRRGDVIVFNYPKDETKLFVKRVIGIPGDVIEVRNQAIYLNGTVLTESYIQHTDTHIQATDVRDNLGPVTVPPDSYFVLGDNREDSLDSRFWGYVPKGKIMGKAEVIYFSIDHNSKTVRWNRLGVPVR